jgi:hypothetical protein
MTNESASQAKAAESSWVESIRLESRAAEALIAAFSDDLLPQPKESK